MRPIVDNGPAGPTASLYVHLPFCRERCTYCAFPTVADDPALHAPLVDAVLAEARRAMRQHAGFGPVESVYLGGGTPGLMPTILLARLLSDLAGLWTFSSDVEVTLEANPANVTGKSLADWGNMGVNRLSVGVQTFHDPVLARLGRRHDSALAERALRETAENWPHTWSADLLAGWSGQRLADLDADVSRLVGAGAPHISVYALMIEDGTPLAAQQRAGRRVSVSPALHPALDARTAERLEAAGFERYEVSNYARPGHRSRHNQAYWADRSYLGLGPGAASSIHPHRWVNRADLPGYLESAGAGRSLRASAEFVSPESRLVEALGIGLRTCDGLSARELDRRFGPGVAAKLAAAAGPLVVAGLLQSSAQRLAIPTASLARADAIVGDLIVRLSDEQPQLAALGR